MFTLITENERGVKTHIAMTQGQARDIIERSLRSPPVQFVRIEDGWQILTPGQTRILLRLRS